MTDGQRKKGRDRNDKGTNCEEKSMKSRVKLWSLLERVKPCIRFERIRIGQK